MNGHHHKEALYSLIDLFTSDFSLWPSSKSFHAIAGMTEQDVLAYTTMNWSCLKKKSLVQTRPYTLLLEHKLGSLHGFAPCWFNFPAHLALLYVAAARHCIVLWGSFVWPQAFSAPVNNKMRDAKMRFHPSGGCCETEKNLNIKSTIKYSLFLMTAK